MRPLFEDDEIWARFRGVLLSWIGTPYRHLQMVKGGGADCTLFVGACLQETGILGEVTFDPYPRDWHLHEQTDRIMEGLLAHFKAHLIPGLRIDRLEAKDTALLRGDCLGITRVKTGLTHHLAIYVGDGRIVHSLDGVGVRESFFDPFWRAHAKTVFRLMVIE